MNIEKILCDHRFVLGSSVLLALYISFMGKLQVPTEITNLVNSTVGRIIILVLIVYLNDKCQTVSLMLAIVFCLSLKSSNTENFYVEHKKHKNKKSEEDDLMSEEDGERSLEDNLEDEESKEIHHEEGDEEHLEEHHEEHNEEEHHDVEKEENNSDDEEITGIESFTNYSVF